MKKLLKPDKINFRLTIKPDSVSIRLKIYVLVRQAFIQKMFLGFKMEIPDTQIINSTKIDEDDTYAGYGAYFHGQIRFSYEKYDVFFLKSPSKDLNDRFGLNRSAILNLFKNFGYKVMNFFMANCHETYFALKTYYICKTKIIMQTQPKEANNNNQNDPKQGQSIRERQANSRLEYPTIDSIISYYSLVIIIISIGLFLMSNHNQFVLYRIQMQCPQCRLRFTTTNRTPIIQPCGHTLCQQCLHQLQLCCICQQSLKKQGWKVNYSLFEILERDTRNIDKFIKVCFIGSSSVGKTSLIRMLTGKQFSSDIPTTVGYDFLFVDRMINGFNIRFQLWDSAGQQRYRAVSPIHYKNSHIIVIVYNLCFDSEDNQVSQWIKEAQTHSPEGCQKILIGNKTDLAQSTTCKPLDSNQLMQIKGQKIPQIHTSCKDHTGLKQFWSQLEKTFNNRHNFSQVNQHIDRINQKKAKNKISNKIHHKKKQTELCC